MCRLRRLPAVQPAPQEGHYTAQRLLGRHECCHKATHRGVMPLAPHSSASLTWSEAGKARTRTSADPSTCPYEPVQQSCLTQGPSGQGCRHLLSLYTEVLRFLSPGTERYVLPVWARTMKCFCFLRAHHVQRRCRGPTPRPLRTFPIRRPALGSPSLGSYQPHWTPFLPQYPGRQLPPDSRRRALSLPSRPKPPGTTSGP